MKFKEPKIYKLVTCRHLLECGVHKPPSNVSSLIYKVINMNFIKKFVREEDGATAIEYALMVALIAVGIIATVRILGTSLNGVFTRITTALNGAGV